MQHPVAVRGPSQEGPSLPASLRPLWTTTGLGAGSSERSNDEQVSDGKEGMGVALSPAPARHSGGAAEPESGRLRLGGGLREPAPSALGPAWERPPPKAAPVARIRQLSPGLKVPHSALGRHPCAGLGRPSHGSQPAGEEPALGGPAPPHALRAPLGGLSLQVPSGACTLRAPRPAGDTPPLPRPRVLPGDPGAGPEHQP